MKNIKINKKLLSKGKFILITIPIVAALVLSGCELSPNGEKTKYTNINNNTSYNISYTEPTNINQNEIDKLNIDLDDLNVPLKDIGDINLSNLKVKYDNKHHLNFKSYLDSVEVTYDYEHIYGLDNALGEYNKLDLINSHNLKLKTLDLNELYNIIVNNNKEYKKHNNSVIFKELSANETREIASLITETVKDFINSNSNISAERIMCVLSDLKLFKQNSSMSNAFVTNDNCLVLSPNMLEFANTMNGKGTDNDVLVHEIMHLLQKGCNCDLKSNENLKRNFGICYGFQDIKINSLDFTWFYEASAEKSMSNYTKHDIFVYKNMIGYLESLSIVNLVNKEYKVNDTENLSFKRTLDDLYKYFGVTDEKDKKEILNMMYSIEVMQQAPLDFYKLLEEQTGKQKDNVLIDEVNYNVKVSICETLTKHFYRNLSNSIINQNVSLGDIFYLISVFENDINNHILYDRVQKYGYNERFINTYIEIQDNFFLELAKAMNCKQEEIEEYYNNYNSNIKIGDTTIENYSLEFLDNEKIAYLKERETALNNIAGSNIRSVANEFYVKGVQKVYN